MNTQELTPKTMNPAASRESSNDAFSQSLLLWIASFPVFAIGLSLLGGALNTVGYVIVLAAAICFFSPVVQLLGCLTDKH